MKKLALLIAIVNIQLTVMGEGTFYYKDYKIGSCDTNSFLYKGSSFPPQEILSTDKVENNKDWSGFYMAEDSLVADGYAKSPIADETDEIKKICAEDPTRCTLNGNIATYHTYLYTLCFITPPIATQCTYENGNKENNPSCHDAPEGFEATKLKTYYGIPEKDKFIPSFTKEFKYNAFVTPYDFRGSAQDFHTGHNEVIISNFSRNNLRVNKYKKYKCSVNIHTFEVKCNEEA